VNVVEEGIHRRFTSAGQAPRELAIPTRPPLKILLLEDDRRLGDILVRAFRQSGHSVDHVATVEDAAWQARSSTYDVLVLDVMLPDGDGYSLCAQLRDDSI
jgi:two-component system OmpR family response regulator